MAALWAEFSEPEEGADRRGSLRRTLRLVARAAHDEIADEVLILDLSTTGLMFETSAALAASETIEVELPMSLRSPHGSFGSAAPITVVNSCSARPWRQ
jgi:hypothetical protein